MSLRSITTVQPEFEGKEIIIHKSRFLQHVFDQIPNLKCFYTTQKLNRYKRCNDQSGVRLKIQFKSFRSTFLVRKAKLLILKFQ